MFLSIRVKLFFYMTAGIAIFAVLLYLSNSLFIKNYYINKKKQTLAGNAEKVKNLIREKNQDSDYKDENFLYALHNLEKSLGIAIHIGNTNGAVFYPPFPMGTDRRMPPPKRLQGTAENTPPPENRPSEFNLSLPTNGSAFFITKDENIRIDTLRYQLILDKGLILQVWVPMAEIDESASISNSFTAIIALVTVFITALWALFISGQFTRPIREMSRITKRMALLDFSQSLETQRRDEIGQLSQNINHLSEKLDSAVRELSDKNKQLEQDIDKERRLDKMRREFVSSVSHELKTPIFIIQGYADGLKANVIQDDGKKNFYCDVIIEETEKMNAIIRDLLDLSQIESGMFTVNKTDFDICALIREEIEKYESAIHEKNIHIAIKAGKGLMVHADPVRIEQVIMNYMNNAVAHADDKGIIRISVSTAGKKARVSVYNSGKNIPEEYLEKIWASFYKTSEARTRDYGGTGLGLSVVRAIQKSHNNSFGVHNQKGGVEFWFDIDLSSGPSR